jgi:GAF domain-containing protein
MADLTELQRIAGRLESGDIDNAQFLELFTRFLAGHIGCSRAGVWIFIDAPATARTLRCVAMYDAGADRMVACADLSDSTVGAYFDALEQEGAINAPDALAHPALRGFAASYLVPLDVRSVLEVCFSVNGHVFGVFSCEQVGQTVAWTQRQFQALRQIGSRASLSLMHSVSSHVDTAPGALWESSNPSRLATTMAMPIDALDTGPKRK